MALAPPALSPSSDPAWPLGSCEDTMIPQASPPVALLRNLALGLALVAGAGCGGKAPRDGVAARVPSGGPSPSTKSYPLAGVVRQVEVKSGLVTIRHRGDPRIHGCDDHALRREGPGGPGRPAPGDEVEGTLRVVSERGVVKDYELVDLRVTRPAPAPKMTLNLSGGTAQLGPRPGCWRSGRPSRTSP